jgi:hypothetical protein
MLQLINAYLKTTYCNDKKFEGETIADYFDTELESFIRFIYSNHKSNYDCLFKQEQLNNIVRVKQEKGENYENVLVGFVQSHFQLSSAIKYSSKLSKVNQNLIKYSKLLDEKNLNKLRDLKINPDKLLSIPEGNLILDSVRNYYYGSIYDLLLDPVWSLVDHLSEEYYKNEKYINELFGFKYDSIDTIIRMSKKFRLFAPKVLKCILDNELKNLDKLFSKASNASKGKWKFIVYDILLNGRYKGFLKNTDKECDVLYTYLNMYRDSGIHYLYEIGGTLK